MRLALAVLAAVLGCGGQPSPAEQPSRDTPKVVLSPWSPFDVPLGTRAPSLRDVVRSRALVGRPVRLTGHCLAVGSGRALGRPPRHQEGWQFEADDVAIFIIGPPPLQCDSARDAPLEILALVAEDTLPAISDLPPAPRRYLVLLHAGPLGR